MVNRRVSSYVLAALFALAAVGMVLSDPVSAKTVRYDPQTVYFTYCYAHPPAATIASGDTVITKTRDASNDAFAPTDKTLSPKLDLTKVNPQTGPFFVEGAEPGDTLEGQDRSHQPEPQLGLGRSDSVLRRARAGVQDHDDHAPRSRPALHLEARRRVAWSAPSTCPRARSARSRSPCARSSGRSAPRPAGKECISSLVPGPNGANMDFNEVVQGVTMYFPVFERGALFMLGDGHAAQGDGEIMGAAVETSFDVQFTVEVIKGKKINWPRLENDRYIMSIGSTRPLMDALRLSCADLIDWLATDYGYDRLEAYQLLGQQAVLKIANVVDPQYSVACAIDKKYLPK